MNQKTIAACLAGEHVGDWYFEILHVVRQILASGPHFRTVCSNRDVNGIEAPAHFEDQLITIFVVFYVGDSNEPIVE